MAENKKSFVAYSDWHGMFKQLPDDVAGKLIKHIFSYVNDENPKSENYIINALFEQIKATLKRDLEKWDAQKLQRSLAGKKSAEIRSTKINDRSTTVNENERKQTVSVNVNVSDNVKGSILVKNNIEERKLKFAGTLKPFLHIYGKDLLNDFYHYWTEPNKSNTKLNFELQKTWSVERRLNSWSKNEKNFNKKQNGNETRTTSQNNAVEQFKQRLVSSTIQ